MKYSIIFTETAKTDLRDIAIYIAEESKDKEIAKLVSSGYRFLVHKEYLIFYSTDETNGKVYISAVFNAKKDYTRVLKKLI